MGNEVNSGSAASDSTNQEDPRNLARFSPVKGKGPETPQEEEESDKPKVVVNGYAIESDDSHIVVEKNITEDEFEKIKVIGKGLFGIVYLVKKRDNGKFYAMKKMDKKFIVKKKSIRHIKSERFLLAGVQHPFIINLRYAFQSGRFLYLVMEYINGGTLFDHLNREKKFPEKRVKHYTAELFLALEYLHESRILHRDLKLENILMDGSGHIILTDFGLSKLIKDENKNKTLCGTLDYLSPEMVLVSKKKRKGYGKAVDYYAMGVLIYEMLYGFSPFRANNLREAMQKILQEKVRFPRKPKVSKEGRDFIKCLLRKNPEKRLGSRSSDQVRNHPWFFGLDFKKILKKEVDIGYAPDVTGPDDTKYVNKKFLKMPLKWEGGENLRGISPNEIQKVKGAFNDFSYAKITLKKGGGGNEEEKEGEKKKKKKKKKRKKSNGEEPSSPIVEGKEEVEDKE